MINAKQYVIGIDGGGSRSRLCAINANKELVGHAIGGPTNISAQTYEGVLSNIRDLINDFCVQAKVDLRDCAGICIGSAGATIGDNTKLLERIFRAIGFDGKLRVMNDAQLVLLTETKGEPGAIIISGTGSVGYAISKEGNIFRAGGWGHIIDDGGSGYRIGMDAVSAALMDFDGRGERTSLLKLVTDFFGCDTPIEIVGHVYEGEFNKTRIAEIALLVSAAADAGDIVAVQILDKAAKSLIDLALTLIKKANLAENKIVLSGSVILYNKYVRNAFEAELNNVFPNMEIVQTSEAPEIGAAHLALEL